MLLLICNAILLLLIHNTIMYAITISGDISKNNININCLQLTKLLAY